MYEQKVTVNIGVVAGADIPEGRPVVITGTHAGTGLPQVALAGATVPAHRVYVLLAASDDFPRPVDQRWYTAGAVGVVNPMSNTGWMASETVTVHYAGLGMQEQPTIPANAKARAVKGGIVTVHSSTFASTIGLAVGDLITTNSSGQFVETATAAEAIGHVIEINGSAITIYLQ